MLQEERTQFNKEQDQLLKTILNLRFFEPWKRNEWPNNNLDLGNDANIELFITNVCNQKCEYCYLQRFPDLYPSEIADPELIKHNLKLFYQYCIDEKYHIPKLEFFTGEIWHTQFGCDILEITLDYLNKGLDIDWFLIASNCSFVLQDITMQKIQHYINRFRQSGHDLVFSISIDGKIIEQAERPMNNGYIKTDEDYDKLFAWARYNNYKFHPMIAAASCKDWIQNYDWWVAKLKEYGMTETDLMTLEVRNDDWTDENIADYLKVLNYLVEHHFKWHCGSDPIIFANQVFFVRDPKENNLGGYIPYCFPPTDSFMGCTIATDLTIRLGDLAICPCHRTAYNKYLYGHFIVQDDKIIDIQANNPQMAIKVLMNHIGSANFRCDTCLWNDFCLKGCCGSQYENTGDPWIPVPSVCKFFDAKYSFLIDKYKQMGIIDYLKTISPLELEYNDIQQFLNTVRDYEARCQSRKLHPEEVK